MPWEDSILGTDPGWCRPQQVEQSRGEDGWGQGLSLKMEKFNSDPSNLGGIVWVSTLILQVVHVGYHQEPSSEGDTQGE